MVIGATSWVQSVWTPQGGTLGCCDGQLSAAGSTKCGCQSFRVECENEVGSTASSQVWEAEESGRKKIIDAAKRNEANKDGVSFLNKSRPPCCCLRVLAYGLLWRYPSKSKSNQSYCPFILARSPALSASFWHMKAPLAVFAYQRWPFKGGLRRDFGSSRPKCEVWTGHPRLTCSILTRISLVRSTTDLVGRKGDV